MGGIHTKHLINPKAINESYIMQAAIFDMDGTLIDSEPMWKKAEWEVFSSLGVKVSDELSSQTAAMTTLEVTEFWYHHYPWSGKCLSEVENEVVERVAELIVNTGVALEGVHEVLSFFQKRNIKIGLSTNAPSKLIPIVLNKLDISHYFQATSSSEHELNGKPDPAVYFSTAKKLNVEPSKCIAFEDSMSGVRAAYNANMKTVVVPLASDFENKKYDLSNIKLKCLSEFSDIHLDQLRNLREVGS